LNYTPTATALLAFDGLNKKFVNILNKTFADETHVYYFRDRIITISDFTGPRSTLEVTIIKMKNGTAKVLKSYFILYAGIPSFQVDPDASKVILRGNTFNITDSTTKLSIFILSINYDN
jgi:hypothetical protein